MEGSSESGRGLSWDACRTGLQREETLALGSHYTHIGEIKALECILQSTQEQTGANESTISTHSLYPQTWLQLLLSNISCCPGLIVPLNAGTRRVTHCVASVGRQLNLTG